MSAFVNQQFVPVLVNADKHKELMQHLKITSIPTLLVVSPDMVIMNRMNGFQTQAQLHPKLQNDITKYVEVNQQPPVVTASTASTPQPTMTQQPPVAQQPPIGQQPMVATLPTSSRSNPFAPASMEKQEPAVYELPAFEGFCLPSVQESRSLVSGRPEFQLKYHGKTLYFLDA